jgi:N-acetyl-anhydromuramyl-L-alanine amidase AmpD
MDSYFVTIENPGTFKVGEKAIFKGSAGLKVDSIELVVDGFSIGEVGFGRPGPESKQWQLEYVFNGAGKARRLQALVKASDGQIIQNRAQEIDVEAVADPKPDVKPAGKFPVTIVESKVRHVTQGPMELTGIIVHFTASRQVDDPSGVIASANDPDHAPYGFWCISANGIVTSTHPLNRWAYHAGVSRHRTHLGVEILCPGLLTERDNKLFTWYDFKNEVPREKARYFPGGKWQVKGWYWPYTDEQERALVGLIQYVKDRSPKFKIENVFGHDEACYEAGYPGAKNDPGGSLSMSMPAFREYLKTVIV